MPLGRARWIAGAVMTCMAMLVLLVGVADAQPVRDREERQSLLLNEGWSYLEDERPEINVLTREGRNWISVTLPHTWNRTDAVDMIPGYRRSSSWYRRSIDLPSFTKGQRVLLSFEGVNIRSRVYVNGRDAGTHVGGYVGFEIDMTPFVKPGTNVIHVWVSNAYDPDVIPSQKSDFHIYGGITRDVRLLVRPPRSIERFRISTPAVDRNSATVVLNVDLWNAEGDLVNASLEARLRDPQGAIVAQTRTPITLSAGPSTHRIQLPQVRDPALWSPSSPSLYSVDVCLSVNGDEIDCAGDRMGFRWFEFAEHGPFFLNGERLLLRGTHRHEDLAGMANALPDSLHRRDMQMIKAMGANFVRLAHYPQDPEVYRACDELGLLVWDELPWCRGGVGSEQWKANTRRLLREQIERNFNHPSIIIHSLGNEMSWLPDFQGGDNIDSLRSLLSSLNAIAKGMDPGRVTALRKFDEAADLVDIVSPSLWPGWYSGYYQGYESALANARKRFPRFVHMEFGGDSHVGRHTENPISGEGEIPTDGFDEKITPQKVKNVALSGDWSETYIVNLFDWYLHISERTGWFTGSAQWAFKDFPTPLRPENPIPYINQKGLVDRAGRPKDAYYVFKSYWTTSPEFCYIQSHTWTERSGPTGVKRSLKVFSNCPEVELLWNGESQGRRTRDVSRYPAAGLTWDVQLAPGENSLVALGFRDGHVKATDTLALLYRQAKNSEPDRIVLRSSALPGGDLRVTATVVDRDGLRCLDYQKRVYFTLDGGGELLLNEGIPGRSAVIEFANGEASVEIRPERNRRSVVEARNQDFKGSYLIIE